MNANAVNEIRTLEIVEADYVANRDGTGMVLLLRAQFIDVEFNPHAALVTAEMNLEHVDPTKREQGQRDFAALRWATGVLNPQDTSELLFKPFRAEVACLGKRLVISRYIFDDEALAA